MPQIAIDIPEEILHAARMTPADLRLELAIHLFARGRLSFGKARELAGVSAGVWLQTLGSREIPVHYDQAEYQEDLATLDSREQQ